MRKDLNEPWRLFIAIELPQAVRHQISDHIGRLRQNLPDVRASWTREQNLHLTLKFFGDTAPQRAESISQALKTAASPVSSFEMEISDCGAFPPRGKPNVLWIGINDTSGNLQKLYNSLEEECSKAGFERERRAYHPHLTIARIRNPANARPLAELHSQTSFAPVTVKVNDACLIRSELSSAGSRYTVVARHQLLS